MEVWSKLCQSLCILVLSNKISPHFHTRLVGGTKCAVKHHCLVETTLHLAVYIPHKSLPLSLILLQVFTQVNGAGGKPNSKATLGLDHSQSPTHLLQSKFTREGRVQLLLQTRDHTTRGFATAGPDAKTNGAMQQKSQASNAQSMLLQSASEDLSSHLDTCSIQLQVFIQRI